MKLLIKQARVIDPHSPHHGKTIDILIENGTISQAGPELNVSADLVIKEEGLHVSPGWVDIFADFADPGYEYKESLLTGASAAAAGGFTDVFVIPNTKPVVHNKSSVEYIKHKSSGLPVNIHPLGAVTNNIEGKDLAEMYDMKNSGAIAFSDGLHCIQSSGLLLKALQYVKAFEGVIIQVPEDKTIGAHGLMNEGIASTRLGLAGKPAMAEELMVERDINLAQYTNSSIHLTGISTRRSLDYISKAKKEGIQVSCSVTPAHLVFCDEDLSGYDSIYKLNPPLRTSQEKEALKKAILEGEIDCVASHHLPHENDSKVLEFEYAKPGMIGLETSFAVLSTAVVGLPVEAMVALLSANPRRIFKMPAATIREGEQACITLFDPNRKWTFTETDIRSLSRNTPFKGHTFIGKALGIINNGQYHPSGK